MTFWGAFNNIAMNLIEIVHDFIRDYFDKLLMIGLFVALVWIGATSVRDDVKSFVMGEAKTVIGCLISLVTGVRIGRALGATKTTRTIEEKKEE